MKIKNLRIYRPVVVSAWAVGFMIASSYDSFNNSKDCDKYEYIQNENNFTVGLVQGCCGTVGVGYLGKATIDSYKQFKKSKSENNEEEMQNLNKEKIR